MGQLPRRVQKIESQWITLADGCRLAARIWLAADADDDPLSTRMKTHWTETFGRGDWYMRVEIRTTLTADQNTFFIQSGLEAFEGDERIYHRNWDRAVPRDMV